MVKKSLAEALEENKRKINYMNQHRISPKEFPLDTLTGSSEESAAYLDSLANLSTGSTEYFPNEPYTETVPYTQGKFEMAPPPVMGTNVGMASREAKMNPLIEYLLNWLNPSREMATEAMDMEIMKNELNRNIGISQHNIGQQDQLDAFMKYKQQPR
jgi:hypothetical protein